MNDELIKKVAELDVRLYKYKVGEDLAKAIILLVQSNHDRWISSEELADKLFSMGDEPNSPCARIEFKGGNWPEQETQQGGLCKTSLIKFFKSTLPSPPKP